MAKKQEKNKSDKIEISAPRSRHIKCLIVGTSPLMLNKFSQKAKDKMMADQEAGSQKRSSKVREPKDFVGLMKNACHRSTDGWYGHCCSAIRTAMVDACRLTQMKMTLAKMAIFVIPDGYDRDDHTPLFQLDVGEPELDTREARQQTTIDIRPRPRWNEWRALITIKFDESILSLESVVNLLCRAGEQIGIGEGRNFSKNSCGLGFGCFRVESVATADLKDK